MAGIGPIHYENPANNLHPAPLWGVGPVACAARAEVLSQRKYGPASDMWSFGVIMFLLLGGYPPFQASSDAALFAAIQRGQFQFHMEAWGRLSPSAADLVAKLLRLGPEERLTAAQVRRPPPLPHCSRLLGRDARRTGVSRVCSMGA